MSKSFFAFLRGSEEVPPVRTFASGRTTLQLENETELRYRLVVNNIRNLTEAHIHLGRRGQNGPVAAFLFGPVSPGITVTRGIVEGTITREDLVGPLQGRPLSALVSEMRAGNTYVNAHTKQNPEGEIRGQVRRL
ncbi:MAG: CHRD domain-containing protein [Bacillota bacterium]|nr:CHRD domain-containing protein [Bacillota bacterium]